MKGGMQPGRLLLFGLVLALAAGFILVTGAQLPDTVASQFGASGAPNSFMPRRAYVAFMAIVAAVVPLVMVFSQDRLLRKAPHRIRLPHQDYWVAPERIEETRAALTGWMMAAGTLLALLICFTHWEVVQANLRQPPRLDTTRMTGGLVIFLALLGVLLYGLNARFRRPPPGRRGPIR